MKIPLRIKGRTTSINTNAAIDALYYLCINSTSSLPPSRIIQDFCYNSIEDWEGSSARGLSKYISNRMLDIIVETISDEDTLIEYQKLREEFKTL